MTAPRFASHDDARKAGWFSRRHETSEAHREAGEKWRTKHGKEARRRRAAERKAT